MKHEHPQHYTDIKITSISGSQVEITGEIKADAFEEYFEHALEYFKKNLAIPGFRKGSVPEAMILKKVGEQGILDEASEMALQHEYGHIIVDHKIAVIGRPSIEITSIGRKKPLGFKITVAVFPEIKLADYKKLAKKHAGEISVGVEEKEIDEMLENIRKAVGKDPLPEINDEFAKIVAGLNTVAELREKVKENLHKEKTSRESEKKRIEIGKDLVAAHTFDVPETLIEGELKKMMAQFKSHVESIDGASFTQYLKDTKKTEADIKKDWRQDAHNRVALQIILNKIAQEEKLLPTEEEIKQEMDSILSHYKDGDPDHVRAYVETILGNEKVFAFLEGQK